MVARRLLSAGRGLSLPIATDVLQSHQHALSGAGSPPAGFPLDITDFSTSRNAKVNGSALQLTADQASETGGAVYDQFFSSLDLSVQFTYDCGGNAAGNLSAASSTPALTIDTAVPTVTATAMGTPADPATNAELLARTPTRTLPSRSTRAARQSARRRPARMASKRSIHQS